MEIIVWVFNIKNKLPIYLKYNKIGEISVTIAGYNLICLDNRMFYFLLHLQSHDALKAEY